MKDKRPETPPLQLVKLSAPRPRLATGQIKAVGPRMVEARLEWQAKFDADLLQVLADLLTMPLPNQAQVWGDFLGVAAGAMMAQKGWTIEEAQRWVLDRMRDKIDGLKETEGAP